MVRRRRTVGQFYDHPLYVQSLVQRIGSVLRQFADSSRVHLVFSAHGLPMSLVEKGDPYPGQVEATVRMVCEEGRKQFPGWPVTHLLCYQSRVGPAKWLQPPLTGTIERLGTEGVKEMLVVPISFRYRAYRDAARNQYRGPRGSQEIRHRSISHDARGWRFTAFYRGAEGSCASSRGYGRRPAAAQSSSIASN